jgi:beta-lactamase regulating signal transducer with metallopeptidase domain
MNFPNFTFWSHVLATLGVEVCCLAALSFVAQLFFRPAIWQRAVWQMCVICLLLLAASEWTGFGCGTAGFLFGQKQVVERAQASGITMLTSEVAVRPVPTILNLSPPTPQPAVWWPGWVWLAGAVIVLARMAAAQGLLLALRLRRERIADSSLRDRVEYVANRVGLRRNVSLFRMPKAISPMAFGILRPSIGLPPEFEAKFSVTEQEAVLAHELAHLAAMDPLWFLLADFASALLWWHPLVWWVRRSQHVSAELAADEATALVPDGPGALAKCLVSLGKEMSAVRGLGWVGINGGFRSKLGKRVERLMRMSGGAKCPSAGWLSARITIKILVVPALVLLFGSFQSAHAQKKDTWRDQFKDSWRQSPAGVLLLAKLDEEPKPNATNKSAASVNQAKAQYDKIFGEVNVKNAKHLYELGKIDEAEAMLRQVLKDDPSNRSAKYYLDLIKEARYAESQRAPKPTPIPIPNATAGTNLVHTNEARQRILSKLENIALNDQQLLTKSFRVNPKIVVERLKLTRAETNSNFEAHKRIQAYFAAAGVDLTPPKAVVFSARLGDILVRASASDLEIIQMAVAILNWTPPPVMFEAKFVELSPEESRGFKLYQVFPTQGTLSPGSTIKISGSAAVVFSASIDPLTSGLSGMLIPTSPVVGIMSDAEFRKTINVIEQSIGADILTAPKVTTESGRQAHIGVSDGDKGSSLDVIAEVGPDGFSIQTTAIPSIKTGSQTWQCSASQRIWDGQTLAIVGENTNQPPGERRVRMVFVTPRIMDPAGNPLHTDDELQERR